MPESILHRKLRTQILPTVGERLVNAGAIAGHGPEKFSVIVDADLNLSYKVKPDYTFTLPNQTKVPVEIVHTVGTKGFLGDILIAHALPRYCNNIAGFVFIVTRLLDRRQQRLLNRMMVAAVSIVAKQPLRPIQQVPAYEDAEKMHDIMKQILRNLEKLEVRYKTAKKHKAVSEIPCSKCSEPFYGVRYMCEKCASSYCFQCSYQCHWKCPKCGSQLT